MYPKAIENLIQAFKVLPGVGQKSAVRMAFHLLEHQRQGALKIQQSLAHALETIKPCPACRNLTDQDLCHICNDPQRDTASLCIVETPNDVYIISQATQFEGKFFVLMGHLSPLDGVGPEDLGLDILEARLQQGLIKEIILATNSTTEGEATAYYIYEIAQKYGVEIYRIAHGVPIGGELEFLDYSTLSHAFNAKQKY